MVARLLLLVLMLAACAPPTAPPRIALLAPFEGRYREIGYQALYAVRLAISERADMAIDLLAVDDGGSTTTAHQRAQALTYDPQVAVVIILGHAATSDTVLAAFSSLPVLVAGEWGATPTSATHVLSHPDINSHMTLDTRTSIIDAADAPAPFTGGLILTLMQFPQLRPTLDGIRITTTAPLPDTTFRERYLASDLFVPEPGPIAASAYDAGRIVIDAIDSPDLNTTLVELVAAYRAEAALHTLQYDNNGRLVPSG